MKLTRKDYEKRQHELTQLYRKCWPELNRELASFSTLRSLSRPFLLDLTAHNFPEAQSKLLVVGQQTNGWDTDHATGGDLVDDLLWLYKDFEMGANYVRSPFWAGTHELYGRLNIDGPATGFAWTNVLKVDEANGRPQPDVVDVLFRSFNLLSEEIRLAQPDVVVFFTGPTYDDFLKRIFGGIIFHETSAASGRLLVRLEYDRSVLPHHTYRTYHPKGLRLHNHWNLIEIISRWSRLGVA